MLGKLVKLANQLDQKGLYQEADLIDALVKIAASQSGLIRALKSDDPDAAIIELGKFIASIPSYSTPDKELGMTAKEFNRFLQMIKRKDLIEAKKIMGVDQPWVSIVKNKEDEKIDPLTHSPFSGQPWKSGPVKVDDKAIEDAFYTLKNNIRKIVTAAVASNFKVGSVKRVGLGQDGLYRFSIEFIAPYDLAKQHFEAGVENAMMTDFNDAGILEINLYNDGDIGIGLMRPNTTSGSLYVLAITAGKDPQRAKDFYNWNWLKTI